MQEKISNTATRAEAAEWEPLARVLEQLVVMARHPVDQYRIRRAIQDAAAFAAVRPGEGWWELVVEAGTSLGLRCRVVDGSPFELVELAATGALLIIHGADEPVWLGLAGRGRALRLVSEGPRAAVRVIRSRNVENSLRSQFGAGLIRGVVAEIMPAERHAHPGEHSPWRRLRQLLQPETGDIGIVAVFAVFSGLLALATPIAVESLVNTVSFGRLLQPILVLTVIVMLVLSFAAAIRAVQTYLVEIIQQRLFARISTDLAWRLPRVQTTDGDHPQPADLVNRFLDVVTVQKSTAQLLLDGIAVVLGTLIGMTVLAFYHPWLLVMDLVLLVLMVLAVTVMGRGAVSTSVLESVNKFRVANWLDELARCPLAFKQAGGGALALQRADQLTRDYLIARQQHFSILMRQILFTLGLQAIASTVLLGMGGWLVMINQLTLGQLVAAELIVTVIVSSFTKITKLLDSFYDLMAAVEKVGTLFDLPVEHADGLLGMTGENPIEINVRGVSYAMHEAAHKPHEVTLRVAPGERVALGGGDSRANRVLLDMLFGLRQPTAGYITLDSMDPRDVRPDVLRSRVAYLRGIELFHGTVAENVHMGRTDISMQEVRDALGHVGLLDDVLHLPEGLDTLLARDGFPLSDAQAVRLILARALVACPRLVLIDGTLDRLSDHEAAKLSAWLCRRDHPWTLVVATGRRQVADACDRIVELAPDHAVSPA